MITKEFTHRFLLDNADTGRFIVKSTRTGRRYYVEPIETEHTPKWGSIDPATGELMHKKGDGKYRGAVSPRDSMITIENGFEKVHNVEAGTSPLAIIDQLDAKYPSI